MPDNNETVMSLEDILSAWTPTEFEAKSPEFFRAMDAGLIDFCPLSEEPVLRLNIW